MIKEQTVAAFDFDGTLTYGDTLLPFLTFVHGSMRTYSSIMSAAPQLLACMFSVHYRQLAKEVILKKTMAGMPISDARAYGEKFALGPLQSKIRPEAMQRLQWHKREGHRCLLISANLDIYLETWASQAGFHDLICSKMEANQKGNLTGKLIGLNCWGPEKTRRLIQLLGPKKNYKLYAYGDSRGDLPLLNLADYPFYRKFDESIS